MLTAHRASILHFLADPDSVPLEESYQYHQDGVLLVDDGKVFGFGEAQQVLAGLDVDVSESERAVLDGLGTNVSGAEAAREALAHLAALIDNAAKGMT